MHYQQFNLNDIIIESTDGREYQDGDARTNGPTFGIKLTYIPTGKTFMSISERSQVKNKEIVFKELRKYLDEMNIHDILCSSKENK